MNHCAWSTTPAEWPHASLPGARFRQASSAVRLDWDEAEGDRLGKAGRQREVEQLVAAEEERVVL
eukprot:6170279-Pleurochrysis_carterae.AAC.1